MYRCELSHFPAVGQMHGFAPGLSFSQALAWGLPHAQLRLCSLFNRASRAKLQAHRTKARGEADAYAR